MSKQVTFPKESISEIPDPALTSGPIQDNKKMFFGLYNNAWTPFYEIPEKDGKHLIMDNSLGSWLHTLVDPKHREMMQMQVSKKYIEEMFEEQKKKLEKDQRMAK